MIKTSYTFRNSRIMENFVNHVFPKFKNTIIPQANERIKEKGSVNIDYKTDIIGEFNASCPPPNKRSN